MRLEVHPFKTIDQAREWARAQIDQAAGRARQRYITTVPGQEVTYQAKYADALAFARAGYPEEEVHLYPWVEAERDVLGGTAREAAEFIRLGGDPWNNVIGPQIEKLRRAGKDAADTAPTISGVVAITRQATDALAVV